VNITLFLVKANFSRPTLATDMTEAERKVMSEHIGYWTGQVKRGTTVVMGPVLDPKGVYGVGIVEVKDEAELRALLASDPAVKAGLHRDEFYPMSPRSVVRKPKLQVEGGVP
jgi:uncharacterized protein YciI